MLYKHKLNAVASVLTKLDQIVTGNHKLQVRPVDNHEASVMGMRSIPNAKAWTDGSTIYLHKDNLLSGDTLSRNILAEIIGVNYHEVAHVLYTPFSVFTSIASQCRDDVDRWCLNALEDQRIERLFVARYPVAGAMFTPMFLKHVMGLRQDSSYNTASSDGYLYALASGRHYLPSGLRSTLRDALPDHVDADKVDDVVRRFQDLVLENKSLPQAIALVLEFREIFSPYRETVPPGLYPHASGSGHDHRQSGVTQDDDPKMSNQHQDQQNAKVQEAAEEAASEADDDMKDDGGDGGAGTPGASDTDSDSESGDANTKSGKHIESCDVDDELDPADYDEDEEPQGNSGAGADSPDRESSADSYDVTEALYEALEVMACDEDFVAEVDSAMESIRVTISKGLGGGEAKPFRGDAYISDGSKLLLKKVKRHLGDLRVQAEGVWLPDKSGRPNISRIMRAEARGTYLPNPMDSYHDHELSTRVNIAVALDVSYSMLGSEQELSEAAWMYKRAVQDVGGECIVYAYDTRSYLVYDSSDRVNSNQTKAIQVMGGTNPCDTLMRSHNWLRTRDHDSIRIMVTVTDGEWESETASEAVIHGMNRDGITTVLYGLQEAVEKSGSHGCKVYKDVKSMKDSVELTKSIVAASMRAAIMAD